MSVIANRVKVAVDGTPGTGTIDLGAAVTGFQSFADGGVTNGQVVSYAIEDGTEWEVGTGTYTTGTPNTLSRTVIESSNSDAALDLSSNAVVFITALSGDLQNAVDMDQGVATTDSPSFAGLTATTADINGGTIDGTVIGGSTPAAISGTDLTLSGGVYLGGTGAANLLDDYEEGTFTPVLSSSGGGGVNLAGLYTKVGRLITVAVDGFSVSTAGLSAGNLEIAGLPFAPGNANSPSVAYFQIPGATSASNGRALLYLSSGSAGQLYKAESTSAGLNNLTVADLNATVSVRFNGFYYTA